MRKAYFAAITVLTFFLSSSIFADSDLAKGYYTNKHPKEPVKEASVSANNNKKLSMATFLPTTDITIINATPLLMYVTIPDTNVYDPVYPRVNVHVYNDFQFGDTYLILKDPYGNTFYNGNVCRRAIVTVYGQPGNYSIYMDREFCHE